MGRIKFCNHLWSEKNGIRYIPAIDQDLGKVLIPAALVSKMAGMSSDRLDRRVDANRRSLVEGRDFLFVRLVKGGQGEGVQDKDEVQGCFEKARFQEEGETLTKRRTLVYLILDKESRLRETLQTKRANDGLDKVLFELEQDLSQVRERLQGCGELPSEVRDEEDEIDLQEESVSEVEEEADDSAWDEIGDEAIDYAEKTKKDPRPGSYVIAKEFMIGLEKDGSDSLFLQGLKENAAKGGGEGDPEVDFWPSSSMHITRILALCGILYGDPKRYHVAEGFEWLVWVNKRRTHRQYHKEILYKVLVRFIQDNRYLPVPWVNPTLPQMGEIATVRETKADFNRFYLDKIRRALSEKKPIVDTLGTGPLGESKEVREAVRRAREGLVSDVLEALSATLRTVNVKGARAVARSEIKRSREEYLKHVKEDSNVLSFPVANI